MNSTLNPIVCGVCGELNVKNLSRILVEGGSLVVQDFKAFYWSFYTYVVEGLLIEWVFRMRTFD